MCRNVRAEFVPKLCTQKCAENVHTQNVQNCAHAEKRRKCAHAEKRRKCVTEKIDEIVSTKKIVQRIVSTQKRFLSCVKCFCALQKLFYGDRRKFSPCVRADLHKLYMSENVHRGQSGKMSKMAQK